MALAPLTAFVDRAVPLALAGVEGGATGDEIVLALSHPPFPADTVFGPCLAAWAQAAHVVALDFPGTGACPPLLGPIDPVQCSVAILEHLRRRGLRPRHVIAAGLASRVALDLAQSRADQVQRVVLLDPFLPGFHTTLPLPEAQVLGRLASLRTRGASTRLARALADDLLPAADATATLTEVARRDSYRQVLRALAPPKGADQLRAAVLQQCHVRAACLLVCGARSPNSSAAAVAMVLRRFTDARVLALPGAGRFPGVERPDEVAAAVARFLAGDWPVERGLPAALR